MSVGKPILHVDLPKTHPAVIEAARGYFREKMFGSTRVPSIYQRAMLFSSYRAMITYMRSWKMLCEYHWH